MPTVRTRAGALSYDELGSGPPLLLLHNAAHSGRDWDPVRPGLAEHFRTIAVDLPAHGDSPPPPPSWQPHAAGVADLLEDVVESLRLGPVTIVGSSVGGFAAARLAIRQPRAVRALVLVDNGGFGRYHLGVRLFCRVMGTPALLRLLYSGFARFYMRARSDNDREVLRRAQQLRSNPALTAVIAGIWRSFPSPEHNLEQLAPTITAPTLVIWGRHDPVIPPAVGKRAAALIPGAEFTELDAGHLPFVNDPTGFLGKVLPFLRATSTAAPGAAEHG
jgi:pimeloyl-ACP methyl ester carboxylesterase